MANTESDNALIEAAKRGDLDAVSELAADHANINAQDVNGRTGLYFAASNGDENMVMLLLTHQGKLNIADEDGLTPLTAALAGGHFNLAGLLLQQGAEIDARHGEKLLSALHVAVNLDLKTASAAGEAQAARNQVVTGGDDAPAVSFLLDKGANFTDIKDAFGRTARRQAEDYLAQWPQARVIVNAFDAHIEGKEKHAERLQREAAADREKAIFGGLAKPVAARTIRFKPKSPVG